LDVVEHPTSAPTTTTASNNKHEFRVFISLLWYDIGLSLSPEHEKDQTSQGSEPRFGPWTNDQSKGAGAVVKAGHPLRSHGGLHRRGRARTNPAVLRSPLAPVPVAAGPHRSVAWMTPGSSPPRFERRYPTYAASVQNLRPAQN
jgi:hypothetical protein